MTKSHLKLVTPTTENGLGEMLAAAQLGVGATLRGERAGPFTTDFARLVERVGAEAGLPFKVHPHMLRHACGFALANKGHDTRALQAYLGHRNIRFKDFWRS
jgi:integrase